MEVIIIGTFNIQDKNMLDHIISLDPKIDMVWDYKKYRIEAAEGIAILQDKYGLSDVGILIKKPESDDDTFYSYPLVFELSEYNAANNTHPTLFDFFEKLETTSIEKLIIAFADEWQESTLIREESCRFNQLKKRLDSVYVWCESYTDLKNNTEVRDSSHPLVLNVHR